MDMDMDTTPTRTSTERQERQSLPSAPRTHTSRAGRVLVSSDGEKNARQAQVMRRPRALFFPACKVKGRLHLLRVRSVNKARGRPILRQAHPHELASMKLSTLLATGCVTLSGRKTILAIDVTG